MSYLRAAVPAKPRSPEPIPEKEYEVLSNRCVWGKPGEVITMAFTEGEELSLVQAGVLKLAASRPSPAVKKG